MVVTMKSGSAAHKGFDRKEYKESIRSVAARLKEQLPESAGVTPEACVAAVEEFYNFLERELGYTKSNSAVIPRLPAQCFRDFSSGGALERILRHLFELKAEEGLRGIPQLFNAARTSIVMKRVLDMEEELTKKELIKYPKIFISQEKHYGRQITAQETEELTQKINKLKGVVVSNREDATYELIPTDPAVEDLGDEDFLRIFDQSDSKFFVHWYYTPNSYDRWVNRGKVPPDAEVEKPFAITEILKVQSKWIEDSVNFNEWCDPLDYEYEPEEDRENKEKGVARSPRSRQAGKTATKGDLAGIEFTGDHNGVKLSLQKAEIQEAKKSRRSPLSKEDEGEGATIREVSTGVKRKHDDSVVSHYPVDSVTKIANITGMAGRDTDNAERTNSQNIGSDVSAERKETAAAEEQSAMDVSQEEAREGTTKGKTAPTTEGTESKEEEETEIDDKIVVLMPSHASWFKLDAINDIEKRALPEFFDDRQHKTPEVYMEARNFIVNCYRLNPSEWLSVTAVRRAIAMDIGAIIRIHSFLTYWGIINFGVGAKKGSEVEAKAAFDASAIFPSLRGPPSGQHAAVVPSAYYAYGGPARPVLTPQAQTAKAAVTTLGPQSFAKNAERQEGNHSGTVATPITGTQGRLHVKSDDFAAGKFPMRFSSQSFARVDSDMDPESCASAGLWTEAETLLLLEAVEKVSRMYEEMGKEAWDKVAQHVKTKTAEQCVTHFLQLPMEDPFLQDALLSAPVAGGKNGEIIGAEDKEAMPFFEDTTLNPLLTQIGFMATTVSPSVASAAANAALNAMVEESKAKGVAVGEQAVLRSSAAVAAAIGAGAVQASQLARRATERMGEVASELVELQLKKVEAKAQILKELEASMLKARSTLARETEQLWREMSARMKDDATARVEFAEEKKSLEAERTKLLSEQQAIESKKQNVGRQQEEVDRKAAELKQKEEKLREEKVAFEREKIHSVKPILAPGSQAISPPTAHSVQSPAGGSSAFSRLPAPVIADDDRPISQSIHRAAPGPSSTAVAPRQTEETTLAKVEPAISATGAVEGAVQKEQSTDSATSAAPEQSASSSTSAGPEQSTVPTTSAAPEQSTAPTTSAAPEQSTAPTTSAAPEQQSEEGSAMELEEGLSATGTQEEQTNTPSGQAAGQEQTTALEAIKESLSGNTPSVPERASPATASEQATMPSDAAEVPSNAADVISKSTVVPERPSSEPTASGSSFNVPVSTAEESASSAPPTPSEAGAPADVRQPPTPHATPKEPETPAPTPTTGAGIGDQA